VPAIQLRRFLKQYPSLEQDDINACLRFAAGINDHQIFCQRDKVMAKYLIDANLPYYFNLWNNPDFIHVKDLNDSWTDEKIWK